MQQLMKQRHVVWPALALAFFAVAAPVHAQTSSNSPGTSAREVQRGVPGVDVDLNTKGNAANNGVPGVDVDVGKPGDADKNGVPGVDANVGTRDNKGVPGVDVDTRASGAGAEVNPRTARTDRN